MAYPLSIAVQIEIGRVSMYLSLNDVAKKNFSTPQPYYVQQLPLMIAMETDCLGWQYALNPNDPTLYQAGNYLYGLCGAYALQALESLGQGGQIIYFVNANEVVNIAYEKAQFIIGNASQSITAGATTPNAGDTTVFFPYQVMPKSELITYQLTQVPVAPSTEDFYFTPTYNDNSTLYTFSQPLTDGFSLDFQFTRVVATGITGGSPSAGPVIGLQSVYIVVITTGNTLTVPQLGTFVLAVTNGISYENDSTYIIQSGNVLDATAIGGWTAGQKVLILYNP